MRLYQTRFQAAPAQDIPFQGHHIGYEHFVDDIDRLYGCAEPPKPRVEAVRIVDMSESNSWTEFASLFRNTRQAFLEHERSKAELKALMPEDAKEAIGHGIRAKRSKSGAISFDLLEVEASHAAI